MMLALSALALSAPPAPAVRTISFSGYLWNVKASAGRVGPGPNYFSDSPNNVWVDALGRLHLKITRVRGKWQCAEVVSQASFGHGTYRFYLDSPVDALDPSVVLGLFTWSDDPAYNHREIDIEFARWGEPANLNAQYVVQPYTLETNIHRFSQPAGVAQSVHSFRWEAAQVAFESVRGTAAQPADPGDLIQQWTCSTQVPVPGGENARMNLWLFRGRAPTNGQEVEVVIRQFEFVPAGP